MKHNGQNIITDQDITMTGNGFQGEELSGVLSNHQTRIDTLESNVKWIYKNGGVGSGSGGGGSQSTTWKIVVTRGDTNQAISNNSDIVFSGIGEYSIKTQIYGGGSSSFNVRYDWVSLSPTGTPQSRMKQSLVSRDNGFFFEPILDLNTNGSISITVVNLDTQEPIVFTVNYIVTPYSFSIGYVYADDYEEFSTGSAHNIYMSQVKGRGLLVAFKYSMAVEFTHANYSFTDWEGKTHTNAEFGEEYQIKQETTGTIYLSLTTTTDIYQYLSNNNNAKFVQFSLTPEILLKGNNEEEVIDPYYLKDNLIPSGMYLKVYTSGGGLFDESQLVDTDTGVINNYPLSEQFSAGNAVFQLTPYNGALVPGRPYQLVVLENGEPVPTIVNQLLDQQTQSLSIPLTVANQEYQITFTITSGSESYSKTYYLFVKDTGATLNWYPNNVLPKADSNYRKYQSSKNIENLQQNDLIVMSANSSAKSYRFIPAATINPSYDDQFICLGFQYSSVNSTGNPIVKFECDDDYGSITIYQDKLVYNNSVGGSVSVDIFFPMIDDYDQTNNENYHLLSMYKNFEYHEGNNYYRRLYIYLDGVLEATFSSAYTVNNKINGIRLYPGNYAVNLIECSYFQHYDQQTSITYLRENDILLFYYTYCERLIDKNVSTDEKDLLEYFGSLEVDRETNYVMANETIIGNIASKARIPVLLIIHSDNEGKVGSETGYNRDNFRYWMEKSYDQEAEIPPVNVTIKWCGADETTWPQDPIKYGTSPATFKIAPQGSSTKSYRCKNWELYAPGSGIDGVSCLYSPNFDPNDPNSFLPEESFTLKADIVDSSHTNNNAIGNFINHVTTPFKNARQERAQYKNYIKNCLTGFPVLVFLESRFKAGANATGYVDPPNIYFLGIYNFNLGRNSYFNLGYKDISKLESLNLSTGFKIYTIDDNNNNLLEGIGISEIQRNSNLFDFSQYSDTILYKLVDNDNGYMFGDFVSTDETRLRRKLQTLVEKISKGGGYVFNEIGKSFKTVKDSGDTYGFGYDEGYNAVDPETGIPLNQVPYYRRQLTRTVQSGGTIIYTPSLELDPAQQVNLTDLIYGDLEEVPRYGKTLDYTSLCEYYTACMAFGLVDSVQKNLNLKTWNIGEDYPVWYLAFYDMDTCLGVSNSGSRISYFAFSDYWESDIDPDTGLLNPAKIYRDYSPKVTNMENSSYFDIASSYLFAIAKYSYCILNQETTDSKLKQATLEHPSNIWGIWRFGYQSDINPAQGCLSNSDYFMKNYFENHLSNVPLPAFNFNYVYKYFVKLGSSSIQFDTLNFPKFYGRKVYYTKNWLDGRIHLLDAYFNISSTLDTLESGIPAPYTDKLEHRDPNNPDIYVLKDIFSESSSGNQYSNLETELTINAKPYAPLVITAAGNSVARYLFPPDGEDCKVILRTSGNELLSLGGSPLWESISTVNPFITSDRALYINSKYFSEISGTAGICNTWSLLLPSIKRVGLTGSAYSGSVSFSSGGLETPLYPNLNYINISGTSINLEVILSYITTLVADNMTGGSIVITNTPNLSSVSLRNSTLTSITIPIWAQNINLNSLKCERITLSNVKNISNVSLTISGADNPLRELTVSGVTSLTLTGCDKLEKITFEGTPTLKTLTITNNTLNSIGSIKTGGSEDGIIDLSGQTLLERVTLRKLSMTEVILPDHDIDLPANAFQDSRYLIYLSGGGANGYIYLTGSGIFRNCEYFTLKESNGGNWTKLKVKNSTGVTSLDSTFRIDTLTQRGSLDLDAATYFLNDCCSGTNRITSAQYLFYNQNIRYTLEQFLSDYSSNSSTICFNNLKLCNNFTKTLYNNHIYAYNRYMFSGNEATDIRVEDIIGEHSDSTNSRGWEAFINDVRIIYTTTDFLYEIISNIKHLYCVDYYDSNTCLCFINPSNETPGEPINPINLSSVFNPISGGIQKFPIKMTSLGHLEVYPTNYAINFNNLFRQEWSAAKTSGITLSTFFYYRTYNNVSGLSGLLNNIKLISASLFLSSITTSDGEVDMSDFINWDSIGDCTNLFYSHQSGTNAFYSSLGFSKKVSKVAFLNIWNKILTNYQGTGLGRLFYNCRIYNWTDVDSKFYLVSGNNSNLVNLNITELDELFRSCKLCLSEESEDPIHMLVDSDFFKPLPNLSIAYACFMGTYWKNPIPFDFFQKRKEVITHVWIQPVGTIDASERKQTVMYTYNYNEDLVILNSCFSNIDLYPIAGFDPNESYNCGKLTSGNPRNMRTRIIYENNYYQEYYQEQYDPEPVSLIYPEEETDLENLEGTFTGSVLFNSLVVTQNNHELDNVSLGSINPNRLFVSPDILYGCKSNASGFSVESLFAITAVGDQNEKSTVFTGIIPEHLLKKMKSRSITNMFLGLNILPRKLGELYNATTSRTESHYYYVPKNFTSNDSLSNSFNFKLIIPDNGEHFYVFLNNSIPTTTTALRDTLPVSTSTRFFSTEGYYYPYRDNNQVQYHIMGNPVYSGGVLTDITTGINLTTFNKLKLDNLVSYSIAAFLSGEVFQNFQPGTWNSNKLSDPNNYVIRIGYSNFGGLCRNARITVPISNDHFMLGRGNTGGNKVYVGTGETGSCIVNYNNIESPFSYTSAGIEFITTT